MFTIPSFMGFDKAGFGTPIDPDAAAFFARVTAAGGTLSATEQTAVNTLVIQMKADGTWAPMKAIYPMVGASAAACAQNLKSASFTGTFTSGWTFASTGVTPNGTSAYFDTALNTNTLTNNSTHISYYSRSSTTGSTRCEIGGGETNVQILMLCFRTSGNYNGDQYYGPTATNRIDAPVANSQGFFVDSRTNTTTHKAFKSNTLIGTDTPVQIYNISSVSRNIYIGAFNNGGVANLFTDRECALSSIGDGLTDTQASNFYTCVQTFNQTLNRQVGAQIVSDADAQAYINRVYTAGGTLTNTEANAVNQLTIDMKADGTWTPMKAIYPMVGASAAACAQNLKSSSFTGTFSSGWTFASTGVTPNGTSAYFDSNLNENTTMTLNNIHISHYSRTNNTSAVCDIGLLDTSTVYGTHTISYSSGNAAVRNTDLSSGFAATSSTAGMFINNRTTSTQTKYFFNSSLFNTITSASISKSSLNYFLAARNSGGTATLFSNRQYALATIGDGLTDTQASNFYTAVQTFQTTLSRQV